MANRTRPSYNSRSRIPEQAVARERVVPSRSEGLKAQPDLSVIPKPQKKKRRRKGGKVPQPESQVPQPSKKL